jgi:succinate dehydrogenase (ubiquinone) cytochrome b560 subunit
VFYIGAMAYAILPMDSAALATSIHALPGLALFFGKSLLTFPFFFHTLNGIRHLVWDTANQLTIKGVYFTGYAVLGLTTIFSLAFALLY